MVKRKNGYNGCINYSIVLMAYYYTILFANLKYKYSQYKSLIFDLTK